jgi:hypothetical protein
MVEARKGDLELCSCDLATVMYWRLHNFMSDNPHTIYIVQC